MPEPALRMALSRQPEELLPGGDQAGVRAGGAGNVRVDACNRRRGLEGKGPFAAWRDGTHEPTRCPATQSATQTIKMDKAG